MELRPEQLEALRALGRKWDAAGNGNIDTRDPDEYAVQYSLALQSKEHASLLFALLPDNRGHNNMTESD